MREVGHISAVLPTGNVTDDKEITDVQWLPGAREISFVYDGSLWRVSAEAGGHRTYGIRNGVLGGWD